jgi:hypothetical protein
MKVQRPECMLGRWTGYGKHVEESAFVSRNVEKLFFFYFRSILPTQPPIQPVTDALPIHWLLVPTFKMTRVMLQIPRMPSSRTRWLTTGWRDMVRTSEMTVMFLFYHQIQTNPDASASSYQTLKVKTKLARFLFQTLRHEDMHSYLASRWSWVIRFTLRSPYLERWSPVTRWMGGLFGPRAGLDVL